jgi:hypothetical protein
MRVAKFTLKTENDFIMKHFPITPYTEFLHPFHLNENVRRCPGMYEYYKHLYVLPMWFDLQIVMHEDKIGFNCDPYWENWIDWHTEDLVKCRDYFGKGFYKNILKLNTPWIHALPENNSIVQRALEYNFADRFYPFPGRVEGVGLDITIPMLLNNSNPIIELRAGEPLVIIEVHDNDSTKMITVPTNNEEVLSGWNMWNSGKLSFNTDGVKLYNILKKDKKSDG